MYEVHVAFCYMFELEYPMKVSIYKMSYCHMTNDLVYMADAARSLLKSFGYCGFALPSAPTSCASPSHVRPRSS